MLRLMLLTQRIAIPLGGLVFLLTASPGEALIVDPPTDPLTLAQNGAPDGSRLLQNGQQFYQSGQYHQAVQAWQTAAQRFEQSQSPTNQALSLSYLALAQNALGEFEAANASIAVALDLATPYGSERPSLLAQIWNTQGRLSLNQGQAEAALQHWQQAQDWYAKANDTAGVLGAQINEVQALQVLGYFRQANLKSQAIDQKLATLPDPELKVFALRSFGNLLQITGTLAESSEKLNEALVLAEQQQDRQEQSLILNSLGNVYRQIEDPEAWAKSAEYYQRSVSIAPSLSTRVEAKLNHLSLLLSAIDNDALTEAGSETLPDLLLGLQTDLSQLPLSRQSLEAQVNWSIQLIKLRQSLQEQTNQRAIPEPLAAIADSPVLFPQQIAQTLALAIQQSQQLQDDRTESFATGILGSLYEQNQQWQEATQLTQRALVLAAQVKADDIAYRWQWQLGRILNQSGGDRVEAIAAYQGAIDTLHEIRGDLLATNPEFQFSFRESVEPVYREIVSILVQPNASEQDLRQARAAIEGLQLAELEDFFRSSCIDISTANIDELDPTAATIYPIILDDRLEVIRSVPGQPLRHHTVPLGKAEIENTLEQLLQSLNPAFDDQYRLNLSKEVYDWLIAPIEAELGTVETLTFVLDGFFRSIPMAALYDGNQYLIERYSIALAPGLQLVDPTRIDREQSRVLALGVSQARRDFPPLPGVKAELAEIEKALPTKVILDESFTEANMRDAVLAAPFPILHLATHGQFSSVSNNTFLLSWDQLINVKQFQDLIDERSFIPEQPIELLVLSACETAAGDKQAALGLAGFAVQSGARSTLATLWSVSDESTAQFMTNFYHTFLEQTELSRGATLRAAQLSLLKDSQYQHPFYWAPFVLVGNWL
ncbi:MAG: CHAT domain-containing protein [Prochlorotrichaceae cyanobacterium]|jgi:CHAT domain-containing protein